MMLMNEAKQPNKTAIKRLSNETSRIYIYVYNGSPISGVVVTFAVTLPNWFLPVSLML